MSKVWARRRRPQEEGGRRGSGGKRGHGSSPGVGHVRDLIKLLRIPHHTKSWYILRENAHASEVRFHTLLVAKFISSTPPFELSCSLSPPSTEFSISHERDSPHTSSAQMANPFELCAEPGRKARRKKAPLPVTTVGENAFSQVAKRQGPDRGGPVTCCAPQRRTGDNDKTQGFRWDVGRLHLR